MQNVTNTTEYKAQAPLIGECSYVCAKTLRAALKDVAHLTAHTGG